METSVRLALWDITRNRLRTVLMTITLAAALASYAILGAVVEEMRWQASRSFRRELYDITVTALFVAESLPAVKAIRGIKVVEQGVMLTVVMSGGPCSVVVPPEDSALLMLEMADGVLPRADDEIALPQSDVASSGTRTGDTVHVLVPGTTDPLPFRVSGLIADKAGACDMPVVSASGALRLGYGGKGPNSLFIALENEDAASSAERALRAIYPQATITNRAASNEPTGTFADTMAAWMRFLVMVVTSAAVASLFYLSQRERAYESGVLRAVGMGRFWLWLSPVLEAVLVTVAGTIGGIGLLLVAYPYLGLPDQSVLFERLPGNALTFGFVAVVVTAVTSATFAGSEVGSLLRDRWGKA